ncbi:MAG TPA: HNH endonuclease [Armatimonadota bacterium]|nr:HNH endonuclease [Armatimonadota bacterium]
MSSNGVLVLNDNYQPLNVTNARRAIGLLCVGKAHVIESDSHVFHAERLAIELPTVVRLNHHVRRPMPILRVSRKSIFARDHHTCQYCGTHNAPLTIDHVVPKERGGGDDWINLVCCCTKCNNKKGNRMPEEAGMRIRRAPFRPKFLPYISYTKFLAAAANPAWRPYLAPYADMRSLVSSG